MLVNFVRHRLEMGIFRHGGLGVVSPDHKYSVRESGQTTIGTRGTDEVMVNVELCDESNGQNATAGGDDAGLSSTLVDGSRSCDHSAEKRR